jgi:D-alanine-D-alanine ligase-like ATP-grasp enzyme
MQQSSRGYAARLKEAVCAGQSAPLVFLGNFEVENQWGQGEIGLPVFGFASSNVIVNRMDEFALLLAGPDDYVLLKTEPDPGYLASLAALGIELPTVLVVGENAPERTVTQDALADPDLIGALIKLGSGGAALFPHGVSGDEEDLAKAAGLAMAAPSAAICKAVNSKVYSRRLADALGLRQPPGRACTTAQEWAQAVTWAHTMIDGGARLGIKDAYGVSGKGIAVVDDGARLDKLDRMVTSRLRRSGTDRLGLLVEEWVPKVADLNYQFTIARDGSVGFDFVKEAVTENNVHKGHRIPARISAAQRAGVIDAASELGAALAADGYFGVVGVDAMTDPDGGLYPVIEINARNNMSTYQVRIQDEIAGPGQTLLARHYPVRAAEPLEFGRLAGLLDGLLLTRPGGAGLVVNNYATVNAPFTGRPGAAAEGRLYGLVIADDQAGVDRIDSEITERLAAAGRKGNG